MAEIISERRPTLSDVANLAKVSTATASRALSNPGLVSAGTRQAVLSAAARAGYRPNLIARSLRKQQARAVVVLVPGLDNPFSPDIIRGIETAARTRDYSVVLGLTMNDQAVESSYVEMVHSQRADGILVLDGGLQHMLQERRAFPIPSVQVVERLPGAIMPWVGIDDRAAAMKATRHLLDLGHRRIGHIAGLARYSVTPDRIAGYGAALNAAGLHIDPALVVAGDFHFAGGQAATQRLMALPDPPTALFCGNDDSALGALRQLRKLGLKVPRDVSIVGFDDIQLAPTAEPPLTTLRQPRYDIGYSAMTLLIDMLAGASVGDKDIVLPVDMILRDSSAPPPRR